MTRHRTAMLAAALAATALGCAVWALTTPGSGPEQPADLDPLGTWRVDDFGPWGGPWRFRIGEERLTIIDPQGRESAVRLRIEREAPHAVRLDCTPGIPPFGSAFGLGAISGGGVGLTAQGQAGDAVREE